MNEKAGTFVDDQRSRVREMEEKEYIHSKDCTSIVENPLSPPTYGKQGTYKFPIWLSGDPFRDFEWLLNIVSNHVMKFLSCLPIIVYHQYGSAASDLMVVIEIPVSIGHLI